MTNSNSRNCVGRPFNAAYPSTRSAINVISTGVWSTMHLIHFCLKLSVHHTKTEIFTNLKNFQQVRTKVFKTSMVDSILCSGYMKVRTFQAQYNPLAYSITFVCGKTLEKNPELTGQQNSTIPRSTVEFEFLYPCYQIPAHLIG